MLLSFSFSIPGGQVGNSVSNVLSQHMNVPVEMGFLFLSGSIRKSHLNNFAIVVDASLCIIYPCILGEPLSDFEKLFCPRKI